MWLRCVYAPQARHCMCVSVCGRYEVSSSALCSCCVCVHLWASTNILNEHNEHTLWTNIPNTLWINILKTHYERTIWKCSLNEHFEQTFWTYCKWTFWRHTLNKHSKHIMNKHSEDTFWLCANNNNIYILCIQHLSHRSRTEMHPINTHYEHILNSHCKLPISGLWSLILSFTPHLPSALL